MLWKRNSENYEDHEKQKSNHLGFIMLYMLKRSSIECSKTKNKVIAPANQKKR